MKRFLMVFGLAGMLAGATGCHSPGCRSCHNQHHHGGGKAGAAGGGGGLFGKLGFTGRPVGCRPRPLAWQQGGTDYAHSLSYGELARGAQAGPEVPGFAGPMQAGPPTGTYGYPYYTTRGPRDFLLDDPPSIGH